MNIASKKLISGACALALAGVVLAQSGPVVPVVSVKAGAVVQGYELDGVVQPVKQSTVALQASGRIATLVVKAGDHVRAGQLLATVDDRESQTGVQRSQAVVTQAEAELRNAQVQFERARELQAKGFVSGAALDTAESQYKAARAGRDQALAGHQQAALAQGYTRVQAPYEAWVAQTLADAGDLAVPGKPLLVLYAPLPVRAVVQVPASRSDAARQAKQVEVQVTDDQGRSRWMAPTSKMMVPLADPVAQTIEWRLDLPKEAGALVPGQQLRVRFGGTPVQRNVVPASAILHRGELTAVYVVSGQGFVLKAVRLGADYGSAGVEVLAGLNDADQVALDPIKAGLAGARPSSGKPL